MSKVLFLFHSMKKAMEYVESGGREFAPHHFWCLDQFIKNGFQVQFTESGKDTWLNKLGQKFWITDLQSQLEAVRKSDEYDVVFAPYLHFSFFLALLKTLKWYKKPIVAISDAALGEINPSWLKKRREAAFRYVYFHGVDSVLFFNEKVYQQVKLPEAKENLRYLKHWGVDYDFFNGYSEKQSMPPAANYIFTTGGSARDFKTLIEAFREINFPLHITTTGSLDDQMPGELPANIQVDNSLTPSLTSTGELRNEYYHALAVAVPLTENIAPQNRPIGITVLMEALAMGKPVIVTRNDVFPFDVEKEGVGFSIGFGDVNGWRTAVNYLIDHPEEAKKMGERGKELAKNTYNYRLYAGEVIAELKRLEPSK